MRRPTVTFVLLLLLAALPDAGQQPTRPPPLPSIAPLDLGRLLDRYSEGQFDEALKTVARAGDDSGRRLRHHWAVTARQWIDADPTRKRQRALAAAALALETEHLRAERGDWRISDGDPPCPGPCVLDWAQLQLVDRGEPDRAERAWYLAAAALIGGVRDWRYLQRPVEPSRRTRLLPGLIDRALKRFPGDAALRLEEALAAAARFSVTVDGGRMAASVPALPPHIEALIQSRAGTPDTAARMLAVLAGDPDVGPEARLRLGYLQWARGDDDSARVELTKAAAETRDRDLRYLAHFLLGWFATMRGDMAAAIRAFEAADAARPGSQSAALTRAALELQRGDADGAHEIARASLEQRRADADPWRLFLYGHHPRWPERLAELRREVKP